jgi:citrate lyase subunit beta / citryl-CoA lyase
MTAAIRSYLYVRGHDAAALEAAFGTDADAVLVDVAALVPAEHREQARSAITALVAEPAPKPVYVRISATSRDKARRDIAAVAGPGLSGVRINEVEDGDFVRDVARALDAQRVALGRVDPFDLHVFVGTARGIERVHELARATHAITALGFGEGALWQQLGVNGDVALQFARSSVANAARSAGLPGPIQKSFRPDGDLDELIRSTTVARDLGFTARSVWNPKHVAAVHDIYTKADN